MLALTALLLHVAGPVQAASLPEVALVGLHVTGTDAQQAHRELEALATALEQTGRVQVVRPEEVARRIDGREGIIMSEAFLGPARDLLEEGRVLYERADPDQAIPVLEEAVAEFNDTMAYTTENRSLIESLLTLGFAYMVVGEEERARSAFSRVAQLDPGRELDPVNYAPRIVDFYSQVRGEVLQRGSGSLEVLSPQPGAEVFIDGRKVGNTPMVVPDLPVGRHFLAVKGGEGRRSFGVVDIEQDLRGVARVSLENTSLAEADRHERDRSRQVDRFYRSLADHIDADAVLLGGVEFDGDLGLQLYAVHAGNFSKPLTTDHGGDPYSAAADLAPALAVYLSSTGDLRSDRVSPTALSLDISTNAVLSDLLLNPQPKWEVVNDRGGGGGGRWYLWAGVGVLAAGGATAATLALTSGGETRSDHGTIVVEIP